MPVTNYYTIDGQIIGEASGGTRTNYLNDALGSVTATTNSAGTVINTYRYKPYGSQLSKTGVGSDPKFQWVGQHGYRASSSFSYIRARHYLSSLAQWTAADRLWPHESSHGYVKANPIKYIDPSGDKMRWTWCDCFRCIDGKIKSFPNPLEVGSKKACKVINSCFDSTECTDRVKKCIEDCGYKDPCEMFDCLHELCKSDGKKDALIFCGGMFCYLTDWCGYSIGCLLTVCVDLKSEWCWCHYWDAGFAVCHEAKCKHKPIWVTILHEMTHCCGSSDDLIDPSDPQGDKEAQCITDCFGLPP